MIPADERSTAESVSRDLTRLHQPRYPPGHPAWRPSEQWVWQRLCEGAIADFNARDEKILDPSDPTEWDDTRTVSTVFLKIVLLQEPYRSALPRQGVRIVGARFEEVFALEGARLGHKLWLERTRFEQEVQLSGVQSMDALSPEGSCFAGSLMLSGAQIEGQLNLSGVRCTGPLALDGAKIGRQLVLRGARCTGHLNMLMLEVKGDIFMDSAGEQTAQFAAVDLGYARIGGQLNLRGARCIGHLNMADLEVKDNLFMGNRGEQMAQFAAVDLGAARIGGQLVLRGARCTGHLNMADLEVKRTLFMDPASEQTAQFAAVDLGYARIGGQLVLHGARCTGDLQMESIQVASHIVLGNAVVDRNIILIFSRLGGGLALDRAHLASLDLTGVNLQGELRLGEVDETRPWWTEDARLVLRNATVGAIQCPPSLEAWPALELGGCTYQQLGGLSFADRSSEMAARPPTWFIQWLAKDRTFAKQPYHQVASVLRNIGHPETADAVLYASSERERCAARWWTPKWWGMSLLKWTIGYGYGYRHFRSLIWVLGITLMGAIILGTTLAGRDFTLLGRLAYSFDLLLPIIELDARHSLEQIDGWPRYYFYVHELLGYVLAAFVAAGLTGITKR